MPEALGSCLDHGLVVGAQLRVQMQNIIADLDHILDVAHNLGHILGNSGAAGIDGIHIRCAGAQNVHHLLDDTVGATNRLQSLAKDFFARANKAKLLRIHVAIVIVQFVQQLIQFVFKIELIAQIKGFFARSNRVGLKQTIS